MVKSKKQKQQTLEATLGRPRLRPSIKTPKSKSKQKAREESPLFGSPPKNGAPLSSSPRAAPSSSNFMASSQLGGATKKRRVTFNDDDSSSGDGGREIEVALPMRETKRKRRVSDSPSSKSSSPRAPGGKEDTDDDDDDDDDDDRPLATPKSINRRGLKRRIALDDSDDEDDQPLVSSPVKRRRLVRGASSPVKGKQDEDEDEEPAPRPSQRKGRTPRTKKEKARELLRRKRAGEVINEDEEISSSEEEAPAKAIYDTDSDHLALNEFEDDEEGVLDFKVEKGKKKEKSKKGKEKEKKKKKTTDDIDGDGGSGSGSDESMDDFIADDSDEPFGIPDDLDIPLEFTAHSHKPLKEHFRDAIEWLVQFKVNPGFSEKSHQLYRMAWKKLDDEVRGLAQSKFASSAWRTDFIKALRARPYFTNAELGKGDALESQSCGACGRSGHPARWVMSFSGNPYYKDTIKLDTFLLPVETNTSSDSDSDSDADQDHDEDGNTIPKETKQWFVGVVCNSNAETAHNLIHWKHGLLDWVDTRLHEDGYMAPARLAERERMKPKQRYKLVDEILKRWVDGGVVKALYHDFKGAIEQARNKSTTGRYQRG